MFLPLEASRGLPLAREAYRRRLVQIARSLGVPMGRRQPDLRPLAGQKIHPVTFVVVHVTDCLLHNFLQSDCVRDPRNELIIIQNRAGLAYDSIGSAINDGLDQAGGDLVVIVAEDVMLPPRWQEHFSLAIDALAEQGIAWGVLGVAGQWRLHADGPFQTIGCWNDPYEDHDSLLGRCFAEVERVSDHLVVVRRRDQLRCDPGLATIAGVGVDLAAAARRLGLSSQVIRAPVVRLAADSTGKPIVIPSDSPEAREIRSDAALADTSLAHEYLLSKWAGAAGQRPAAVVPSQPLDLPPPVILLAKGGGASRLLADLALDLGVQLGHALNISGDAMDMVPALYRAVLRRYRPALQAEGWRTVAEIHEAARAMWRSAGSPRLWGFKLPESVFVLPELKQAFPQARFLHLLRDPLSTCLRRTHLTARLDNQIGRVTLPAAYAAMGRPLELLLSDSAGVRMACTTLHQVNLALAGLADLDPSRVLELRFEDILRDPGTATREVASWLGVAPVGCELIRKIDPRRAGTNQHLYTLQEVRLIQDLLAPLRTRLGYISLEASDRPAPSAPTPSVAWPFCNPLQALRDPLG
ncbi:MAG: sulfotransferase [Cyanobacteriota bacterium]